MDGPDDAAPGDPRRTRLTWLASLALIALTVLAVAVIWATEPEAQREGAVKRTAMLVATAPVERGSFRPTLRALGAVQPFEDVTVRPRVAGQVLEVDPAFVPGQVVEAGARLVKVDPADARNRLVQRRSDLEQAEAALALEQGRQAVAELERDQIAQQLQGGITPDQEALIVREPQLATAKAAVSSARAALRQAELDLARTDVVAPFRGLVLSRAAHPGSLVDPSTPLGRLVGVERFFVELTLPTARLRFLDQEADAEPVVLRDRVAWPDGQTRTGRLEGVLGQVDDQTRLARVLVAVSDPLALDADTEGPPLMAGAYVEAELPGHRLEEVVRIERAWLRRHQGGDAVWTMEDGLLRVHAVEVLVEDATHAYLADGLPPDARVVTTDLSTVSDGAPLRTASEGP